MGKQLSIYLDEFEARRLTEIAIRECRRPHDQARYFLLNALGLATSDNVCVPTNSKRTGVQVCETHDTTGAFVTA